MDAQDLNTFRFISDEAAVKISEPLIERAVKKIHDKMGQADRVLEFSQKAGGREAEWNRSGDEAADFLLPDP
ncbi:hypothetical protein FOZ61_001393 [Perkinsus olseni]|uniref:Uncharacterized protein n=1 Tax=Perkinsus olseni TaxID=32597 RepID=A0A7J6LY66_PEROL|nr:hypothetical protein FOZ61_001393 [Perkinsus olseni]